MIKNVSIIIVLSFLFIACNSRDKIKKPDNLIPKDKMTNLLYDLYVINAAKGVNRNLLEKNGLLPETYILTKYDIDSTQFADSNAYYAFNTEDYKTIVKNVKDRLEKEKKELQKLQKEEERIEKAKKDSIKKEAIKLKDSTKNIKVKNRLIKPNS